jgi:hypothetical protein
VHNIFRVSTLLLFRFNFSIISHFDQKHAKLNQFKQNATATMMAAAPQHHAATLNFQIDWILPMRTRETLHWYWSKYKIHVNLCENVELHNIVVHCLSMLHKINRQVGDEEVCWLASYQQIRLMTIMI